jgi:flagellar basal body-associated protein FliL
MRRTIAIALGAVVVLAVLVTAAYFHHNGTGPAAPRFPTSDHSATPASDADYRKDIGKVTATRASVTAFPEGDTVVVDFTVTNHSQDSAVYTVQLAVYDEAQTQVGGILISTDASQYGPTLPGHQLRVHGPYAMDNGPVPPGFTVGVASVDRIPVALNQ